MAFIAKDPYVHLGKVCENGHCMRHAQVVAGVPHSSKLRRGERVRDMEAPPIGVAIGTFDENGRYANAVDGSSHVAILLAKQDDGLLVIDQWVGHPVAQRTLHYRGGTGSAANDADQFYIIESE